MRERSSAFSSREDKEALQHQPEGQRHHCWSVGHFCKSLRQNDTYKKSDKAAKETHTQRLLPDWRLILLVSLCVQLDDSFSMQRSGSLDFYQHPAMYWIRYGRFPWRHQLARKHKLNSRPPKQLPPPSLHSCCLLPCWLAAALLFVSASCCCCVVPVLSASHV